MTGCGGCAPGEPCAGCAGSLGNGALIQGLESILGEDCTNPVAFTAGLSQSFYGGGDNALIPYDVNLLNHGDAFEYRLEFL